MTASGQLCFMPLYPTTFLCCKGYSMHSLGIQNIVVVLQSCISALSMRPYGKVPTCFWQSNCQDAKQTYHKATAIFAVCSSRQPGNGPMTQVCTAAEVSDVNVWWTVCPPNCRDLHRMYVREARVVVSSVMFIFSPKRYKGSHYCAHKRGAYQRDPTVTENGVRRKRPWVVNQRGR